MKLVDRPLRDLITAFSAPDPTPGGGSASALASAVGASLLMMVAGLAKTRNGSDDDRAALAEASAELASIRDELTAAIDADTTAYDQVVAAFTLPKGTADEQQARKSAIQGALRAATDVPLTVMRLSVRGCDQAATVAAHGHRGAASDVGVAIALLRAGLQGAGLNVAINVGSVSDAAYVDAARTEAAMLEARASRAAGEADAILRSVGLPPPLA
jgi:formiminotetrahydrofolate cyclodeaminase